MKMVVDSPVFVSLSEVKRELFDAIDKWEKEWSLRNLFMEGLESYEVDKIMGDLKKIIEEVL